MNELKIEILDGELWYSGIVDNTLDMPYTKQTKTHVDTINYAYCNQINPILLSSKGRYVYIEKDFVLDVENGEIRISTEGGFDQGEKENFKDAYTYLKNKYYPGQGAPDKELFIKPQYCTWMALGFDQTQEGVINFAKSILKAGMPAGEIIIDDGWMPYYGNWDFKKYEFPNPKKMCKKLNKMGFTVVVWIAPYISPDSKEFRELDCKNLLLRKGKNPLLAKWWDGFSACVDLTVPDGEKWFTDKIDYLMNNYGVQGVKMDGGDAYIYGSGVTTSQGVPMSGMELCEVYGKVAAKYKISELRASYKCGGLPVMQRVCDRAHAWADADNGFDGIVKKMLVQGLFGYAFSCSDMIGGGLYGDVLNGTKEDTELNIRYMQLATLMPSLQFSKTIWNYSAELKKVVLDMLKIRSKYLNVILDEVDNSAKTGLPIIRSTFFNYGIMPENNEQFFIGEKLLVAPVVKKGQLTQTVYLPSGKWLYEPTAQVFEGGLTVTVPAPLEVLPYFVKI